MLRAKDQMLLDAIAPGDRKAWDAVLSGDAVVVDENGTVMDRAEYLKQLEPRYSSAPATASAPYFLLQPNPPDSEGEHAGGKVAEDGYLKEEPDVPGHGGHGL